MSGALRSKNGCWTCRLRKKKCDEGLPKCTLCTSLEITCYGYGPTPEWVDDGEKERAIAQSLKEIVKHTSRRKTTSHASRNHERILKIAPKDSKVSVTNSALPTKTNNHHSMTPSSDKESIQRDDISMSKDESNTPLTPLTGSLQTAESTLSLSAEDSILLMHFLDNVFNLQYPMYKPGMRDGGRGWLLALLFRSTPFYHAALATSAYHRRSITLANTSNSFQLAALVEQEQHLEVCIKQVNQFAQNYCPKNGLGILSSVVQLMFFELFTGHPCTWQAHLRAATTMYRRGSEQNFAGLDLVDESRKISTANIPLSENQPVVTQEVMNLRFLHGTLIWLDVAFSITSGTSPNLLSYHSALLTSTSQMQLENIMGCKNGMIRQIGRIATLYEQKTLALQQGNFSCAAFGQTVVDIMNMIHCSLSETSIERLEISVGDRRRVSDTVPSPHALVTQTFAYMAFIYLHLVIYGFQNFEELNTSISEAMKNLQTKVPEYLLPALVLPLFFIGSVARLEDEEFFRSIFSSPPLLDPTLKHRGKILAILELIWAKRKTGADFTWKDSLEFTKDVLLI